MEIEKAIELLSDYCDRGCATFNEDFRTAVRIGKKALILILNGRIYISDGDNLKLFLSAGGSRYEPDPRD